MVNSQWAVRVLRDVREFQSVRTFWSNSEGVRDSDIDLLTTEVQNDVSTVRPHVIIIEDAGKPISLLAGRIVRRKLEFRFGYFNLFNPSVKVLLFPYGGLRGDSRSEVCAELIRNVVDTLKEGEADVAILEYLDTNSSLYHWARTLPNPLNRDHFLPQRLHRKRELPQTVEKLYESLSAHERKRFRQIQRKLDKDFSGQVRIDSLSNANDLDQMLNVVEEISKKTWQDKIGHGLKLIGAQMDLFRLEAQKSWLRIYILYLAEKPCAFWIGTVYQGLFFSDFVGFDPLYAQYSPGMFLLSKMLEEFCTQGVRAIDFGFSDEEYKKRFGNTVWNESRIHIFATSPKGLRLALMRLTSVAINEPAKWLLTRTNLVQRTKKLLKRVSARKSG